MNSEPVLLFFSDSAWHCEALRAAIERTSSGAELIVVDHHHENFAVLEEINAIVCAAEGGSPLLHQALWTSEQLNTFVPVIGIRDAERPSSSTDGNDDLARLTTILDSGEGWGILWQQIVEILEIWDDPFLSSRIEDIPVVDILQMLDAGRSTSIVRIDGMHSPVGAPGSSLRKRGCISFVGGKPEIAWSHGHMGIEAVYELLSANSGILDIIRPIPPAGMPNLTLRMEQILLSWALHSDESQTHLVNDAFEDDVAVEEISDGDFETDRASEVFPGVKADSLQPHGQPPEPASLSGADSGECDEPTIALPTQGLSIELDEWWLRNAHAVYARAVAGREGHLVRWMRERELTRLLKNIDGARAIYFAGSQASSLLLSYLSMDQSACPASSCPVVRFGRFETTNLYLVALGAIEGLPVSVRYSPVVICDNDVDARKALRMLGQRRAPVVAFAAEQPRAFIDDLENLPGDFSFPPFFALKQPQKGRDSITVFIQQLLRTFGETRVPAL